MNFFKILRRSILKTSAIAEKNIQMHLRWKYTILTAYFAPIITILMPIIVLNKFFELNTEFGPWTAQNYIVFIFIGYIIMLLRRLVNEIPAELRREKFYKTLSALIVAPFNRFYLLIGYLISEIFMISIPVIFFFVLIFLFYPISFFTILFVISLVIGISLIFAGMGLIIGIFAVSNENIWSIMGFIINLVFWASCVTYPYDLFPNEIKIFINFNPIYFIIDILRWTWIENDIILTITQHPIHISVFIIFLIIVPIVGVYIFNLIYKKFGISGY